MTKFGEGRLGYLTATLTQTRMSGGKWMDGFRSVLVTQVLHFRDTTIRIKTRN